MPENESIFLPESYLPVNHLLTTFKRTTNSYKFYWFWAILIENNILYQNRAEEMIIPYNRVMARMIALSWFTINKFKISLGSQDKLHEYVSRLINSHPEKFSKKDKQEDVFSTLLKNEGLSIFKDFIRQMNDNVTFRLLSPWMNMGNSNDIEEYKEETDRIFYGDKTTGKSNPPIYKWKSESEIEIHPRWHAYMGLNFVQLKNFTQWNLLKYLERRNPHVPNLAKKIELESEREGFSPKLLSFWKTAHDFKLVDRTIFSGDHLEFDFAIDHYIPYAYVSHNQLWNLNLLDRSTNSSKGDRIPPVRFDEQLIALHHNLISNNDFINTLFSKNVDSSVIIDYTDIFHAETSFDNFESLIRFLRSFSREDFNSKYKDFLGFERTNALRLGFLEWKP